MPLCALFGHANRVGELRFILLEDSCHSDAPNEKGGAKASGILVFSWGLVFYAPMQKLMLLAAALLLTACVDQKAAWQNTLASQRQECSAYGFKEGTDAFANCMQNGIDRRRQRAQMAAASFMASRPAPLMLPTIQQPRPMNCNSSVIGTQISTSCY